MSFADAGRIFGRWTLVEPAEFARQSAESPDVLSLDILDGVALGADLVNGVFCLDGPADLSPETRDHCLYDLIVPRLLAHDGALVIHGGLSFGAAGAVGFIGPSGRGKSTLVAGLHAIGLRLMGDDAFVLEPTGSGYDARRIYPSLRLFPDSVSQLVEDDRQTTLMAGYSTKRRVPFDHGPDRAPLLALFRLAEPEPEVRVRRLSMAASCMALVSNSFVLDVDDIAETRMKFDLASAAAQVIPIHDLCYPRSYDRLPEVYAAILGTLGLSPSALQSA
jgi:hypothetical protein